MHTPITEDAFVEPPEEANVPKVTVRRLRRAFKMLAMCCDLHIRRVQAGHGGPVYLQQRGVRLVATVHCSQGTGDNSFCHIEEMVSRMGATRAKTPTTQEIWSRSPDISRELLLSTGLQCNLHGLNSLTSANTSGQTLRIHCALLSMTQNTPCLVSASVGEQRMRYLSAVLPA